MLATGQVPWRPGVCPRKSKAYSAPWPVGRKSLSNASNESCRWWRERLLPSGGLKSMFSYKPRGYLLPILGFILQRKMGFGGLVLKDISSHSLHHVSHALFFVGSMKPICHHHHAFIECIDYSSDPIPAHSSCRRFEFGQRELGASVC